LLFFSHRRFTTWRRFVFPLEFCLGYGAWVYIICLVIFMSLLVAFRLTVTVWDGLLASEALWMGQDWVGLEISGALLVSWCLGRDMNGHFWIGYGNRSIRVG
jgi:hypothetical protein